MAMSRAEFFRKTGWSNGEYSFRSYEASLPCFMHRRSVNNQFNTPEMIEAAIEYAQSTNDVIVFSVTERDGAAWEAWASYAKEHPRKFKVVQGGSIHGNYQARLYIYTKPKSKRKYKV